MRTGKLGGGERVDQAMGAGERKITEKVDVEF